MIKTNDLLRELYNIAPNEKTDGITFTFKEVLDSMEQVQVRLIKELTSKGVIIRPLTIEEQEGIKKRQEQLPEEDLLP